MAKNVLVAVCMVILGAFIVAPDVTEAYSWHKEWGNYSQNSTSDWRSRHEDRQQRTCDRFREREAWRMPWFCDQHDTSYEQNDEYDEQEETHEYTPEPRVDFWVYPSTVAAGEQAHIGWNSHDAYECTAYDDWSGKKSLDGKEYVYPTSDQYYTITCKGDGGEITEKMTLHVEGDEADDDDVVEEEETTEEDDEDVSPLTTITGVVVADDRFETLEAAVIAAGLDDELDDNNARYTVFAPTDAAFAELPEGTVEALLANIPALQNVLLYHVSNVERTAAEVISQNTIEMLNGEEVTVTVDGDTVLINDSEVVITDIPATNGTIHVIDAVLIPSDLE